MSEPGLIKIRNAQERIKKLLKKKGDDVNIDITPTLVLHWWRQLNLAVFHGILRAPVKVHCRNFRDGTWGWCSPRRYNSGSRIFTKDIIFGIRRELDDWTTFLTVLVHEMVHQYEWVHYGKMAHGKRFYSWGKVIKERVGLTLHENTFPPDY